MATHGKVKGRSDHGRYSSIPHSVLDSESYRMASGNAVKVLWRIYRQYNGSNNGDLSAPFSLAKSIRIGSETTWYRCINELIEAKLILCTRESMNQNPNGQCHLFAVTWQRIDPCKGKINCEPTATPPRKFSMEPKL
jgi:hypothetical protein